MTKYTSLVWNGPSQLKSARIFEARPQVKICSILSTRIYCRQCKHGYIIGDLLIKVQQLSWVNLSDTKAYNFQVSYPSLALGILGDHFLSQ